VNLDPDNEPTVVMKNSTSSPPLSQGDKPQGPFQDGEQLGDYRILHLLGRGGMGYVYRAWHAVMKRDVAVKVIVSSPHSSPPEESLNAEIAALVKLKHLGIVSVYDFKTLRGFPCLIMELVDGASLDQHAQAKKLTFPQIAHLLLQLVETMAHAHAQHVFHRDLKPSNVIIRKDDGRAVITDFGLAYLRNAYGETGSEGPAGTVAYMPPEQLRTPPAPVSAASDIFGLGGILFYLLTAQPPYVGDKKAVLDAAQRCRTVPPRALNQSVPRALEKICMKAMAADPVERYGSLEEFAAALRAFLSQRKKRAAALIACAQYRCPDCGRRVHPLEAPAVNLNRRDRNPFPARG
jgi:serine/threonine protein kinase